MKHLFTIIALALPFLSLAQSSGQKSDPSGSCTFLLTGSGNRDVEYSIQAHGMAYSKTSGKVWLVLYYDHHGKWVEINRSEPKATFTQNGDVRLASTFTVLSGQYVVLKVVAENENADTRGVEVVWAEKKP